MTRLTRNRLRIVFVCNHFLPRIGGVELSVHHTALALHAEGHAVTIITETPESDVKPQEYPYTVLRFRVKKIRPFTRFRYWSQMWSFRQIFERADVIHFHDYIPLIHWYLPLRMWILKPVYAITFHGFEGMPIRTRYQVFRMAATWMTDVAFGVGTYLSKYYAHRMDAYYLGAQVRKGSDMDGKQDNDTGNTMRIVYVGRLEADTQILETVLAVRNYASSSTARVEMTLVGDGSMLVALLALSTEYFQLTHTAATVDIVSILRESTVIVATGFLAILDGLASGKPVIIPALTEFKRDYVSSIHGIDRRAFVVDSEDEVHRALESIQHRHDIVKEKLIEAKHYADEQSWASIATLHVAHYMRIREESESATIPIAL